MVKKNEDKSIKQNVKVKQKQNVNVRVHIDQRDTKKKPRQKRRNIPSAKREGVSSFSSGFTPVYIQSGNPYPMPSVPEVQPIKTPVSQEVHTLVNPPLTSTTNLIQEVKSRSISPLSFGDNSVKTPSLNESIGGRIHGRGIMHYEPSNNDDNISFVSNPLRSADRTPNVSRFPLNNQIMERSNEMNENKQMGKEDKKITSNNRSPSPSKYSVFPLNKDIMKKSREINENMLMGNEDKPTPSKVRNISIFNQIKERSGEINEMRNMGNEDINVNVKSVPRVRRTKREIEEEKRRKEVEKTQKAIDKEVSKNERSLMKQEDTRRKEQLKRERNERNRMGRNDINAIDIRGL